jgi:hypothetical protein
MSEEYIMHRFESIHEFVKASEAGARGGEASHRIGSGGSGYGKNWHGTKDYKTAVDNAKYGTWNPGELLEYRNIFDDLEPRLRKFTHVEYHRGMDVSGFEVNMQAYLDGEPDCMFEWEPNEDQVTRRVITLIIGHSISAGCTSQELFIRGQAAIALVRALALLGFELEIWSEETVSGYGRGVKADYFTTLVRLHGAGEIMDESAVEFAVGNPSWLRRLLFGFQEGQPQNIRSKFGFGEGGYGSCTPIKHGKLVGADLELDLGQRWFGEGWGSKEQTAEDGMKWAFQQLQKAGVIDKDAVWEA